MRRLADFVLSTLLAPPCAVCQEVLQRPLDGAVCERCWRAVRRIVPPVCDRCGTPLSSRQIAEIDGYRCATCRHAPSGVDKARAIGAYDGTLRSIVHALKYEGRRSVVTRLASTLRSCGADVIAGADALVPVPLHPRRRRARGFNQARLLATAIGGPVWDVLMRVRHTAPQVDLDAEARRMNVRDAFQIGRRPAEVGGVPSAAAALGCPEASALRTWRSKYVRSGGASAFALASADRHGGSRREPPGSAALSGRGTTRLGGDWSAPPELRGSVLVLVDDVATTGATLDACATVLKAAGAREVRALTAARVVSERRSEWSS